MSYVIVNVGDSKAFKKAGHYSYTVYPTERGAKIACTKLNKGFGCTGQWQVMTLAAYTARPVKMVERTNLMSGQKYMEAEDTPLCCSPASETYWSA
jgi:hypothetical protein